MFKEHDVVVSVCELIKENATIPENTEGTIIHTYKRHQGYEVEFPENKIVTISPHGEIRLANLKEGYILTWGEQNEVHADLISKEHYDKISSIINDKNEFAHITMGNASEEAFKTEPLHVWWAQTYCEEPWPYNGIKILGTISVART